MPAWMHGGQGQEYPYLTVAVRQGSFTHRSPMVSPRQWTGSLGVGGRQRLL